VHATADEMGGPISLSCAFNKMY